MGLTEVLTQKEAGTKTCALSVEVLLDGTTYMKSDELNVELTQTRLAEGEFHPTIPVGKVKVRLNINNQIHLLEGSVLPDIHSIPGGAVAGNSGSSGSVSNSEPLLGEKMFVTDTNTLFDEPYKGRLTTTANYEIFDYFS